MAARRELATKLLPKVRHDIHQFVYILKLDEIMLDIVNILGFFYCNISSVVLSSFVSSDDIILLKYFLHRLIGLS